MLSFYLEYIVGGVCTNYGDAICNLGYACDACPFNADMDVEERLKGGL
jgi:hypothetical protein